MGDLEKGDFYLQKLIKNGKQLNYILDSNIEGIKSMVSEYLMREDNEKGSQLCDMLNIAM